MTEHDFLQYLLYSDMYVCMFCLGGSHREHDQAKPTSIILL